MSNYTPHLKSLGIRLLIAGAVIIAGLLLLIPSGGGGGYLGAFAFALMLVGFVLVASIIIAPALAAIGSEWFGGLFYPSGRVETGPALSIPNAQRAAGNYREAYDGFAALVPENPESYELFANMVEVALIDLKDAALARSALDLGRANLKDPAASERLHTLFERLGRQSKAVDPTVPLDADFDRTP